MMRQLSDCLVFFFFQAEDGIRDSSVTGVQTCALPILHCCARYVCVIAVGEAGELVATARATVQGEIIDEPRGSHGFGYDPYFYYPPFRKTFGESLPEDKWPVSHRGKALETLLIKLKPL